ncbi:histidinol-phosphatase HisJ family protein [Cohnella caldifontis]|uniref:histidinol-phosphatase HisJ family protein n=1 Tax=Cohnella caldifontis TaxID=3027471 RepID=UPI0023EC9C21|nr:histidinol-phosphatase HisJ family protein [Cohnella sp. YIM B05605]
MKVDFHFHLEEGPYSFGWLQRTAKALELTSEEIPAETSDHSLPWMAEQVRRMQARMEEGCFSERWMERFFAQGRKRGIERFGIVDHLYRFEEFKEYYERHITVDDSELGRLQRRWLDRVRVGSIEEYAAAVRKMRKKGHPVSLGVEADYFPGGEEELKSLLGRYELDYVIGSVHFVDGWGFDNPEVRQLFESRDLRELYRDGFELVKQAARSGLFDIIAHLDNLKVFGYRPDEAMLRPMYGEVAAELKRMDVATEINTGLAYRYPVKEACPSPVFLRILHEYGVPITLSSDAHFPDDIGTMLDEAARMAWEAGYREIVYFQERRRMAIRLGI